MYGIKHIKKCIKVPNITVPNPNYKPPKNPVYKHVAYPSHNPRYSECTCYNPESYIYDFKHKDVVGVYVHTERREYGARVEEFHRPIIIIAEEYTPVNCFVCGTEIHKGHAYDYKIHDNGYMHWASIYDSDKNTVFVCFSCHFYAVSAIKCKRRQCCYIGYRIVNKGKVCPWCKT